jgi:hypothetical protein
MTPDRRIVCRGVTVPAWIRRTSAANSLGVLRPCPTEWPRPWATGMLKLPSMEGAQFGANGLRMLLRRSFQTERERNG